MNKRLRAIGLDEYQAAAIQEMRQKFSDLMDEIENGGGYPVDARARALAMTHLETSAMYATKMIAHNGAGEVIDE